ncbi:VENN motif pre-toxin domain-containing protein, partial [Erwinia amylovora]
LKKQDPSKQYSEADIENQVYQNFYHQALTESGFGTGGKVQQAIQAATAAVQGLAGGNIGAAIAGGAAPYLAEVIHKMTEDKTVPGGINVEANLMAHAVVGAVVAQASGHSALAGAAGATTGEFIAQQLYPGTDRNQLTEDKTVPGGINVEANLMAHAVVGAVVAQASGHSALAGAAGATAGEFIAQQLYPGTDRNQLTEEQKQTVSTLGTLAAGLAGGLTGGSAADTVAGAQAGKNAVENNWLHADQALAFDKELSQCRKSGGDCQAVVDKWKQVSDKQSAETDEKLKDNPLTAQGMHKELAQGGIDATERPGWLNHIGADVMTSDEAKAYVQQWNGQDLAKIDVNSPGWTKFAVFISDPENQVAIGSVAGLSKSIINLAKATVSNISQSGVSTSIKSMQIGLRNPQQVDQIKNDMLSSNYRFTAPEGRIAGYIDSKGNYYISEGNHRMVAAQEIYKNTGDASYIEKLLQNGSWTQAKNAPAGAKPMPTRK